MPSSACRSSSRLRIEAWIADIERRDRLVEHQHLRVQRQGAGDSDPLALAAGELVREAAGCTGVESNESDNSSTRCPRSPMPWTVSGSATMSRTDRRGFSDAYGSWNTIWMRRAQRTHLLVGQVTELDAVERDAAVGRALKPQQQSRCCRLAASGFANQSQCLARPEREVDARHGLDHLRLAPGPCLLAVVAAAVKPLTRSTVRPRGPRS